MKLLKPIREYIEALEATNLSEERKTVLQPLIDYINSKKEGRKANPTKLHLHTQLPQKPFGAALGADYGGIFSN